MDVTGRTETRETKAIMASNIFAALVAKMPLVTNTNEAETFAAAYQLEKSVAVKLAQAIWDETSN